MATKKVALYSRVSTDRQTTENQLIELRAVTERHGWQIVDEYIDQGISGAKGRDKRPEFDRLLKDASRKKHDCIPIQRSLVGEDNVPGLGDHSLSPFRKIFLGDSLGLRQIKMSIFCNVAGSSTPSLIHPTESISLALQTTSSKNRTL